MTEILGYYNLLVEIEIVLVSLTAFTFVFEFIYYKGCHLKGFVLNNDIRRKSY